MAGGKSIIIPMERKKIRLGDAAEILRCQVPKEPIDWDRVPGLHIGDAFQDRMAVWEVGIEDIDPLSGFVSMERGRAVFARIGKRSRKFLIRKDDILVNFRGGGPNLGMIGLIAHDAQPMIALRSICVARSSSIDPVWLFHRLRQPDIQGWLRENFRGSGFMDIPIGAIRDISFWPPSPEQVEAINAAHRRMLVRMAAIAAEREALAAERRDIDAVLELDWRIEMLRKGREPVPMYPQERTME